jgi:hypothetical protein
MIVRCSEEEVARGVAGVSRLDSGGGLREKGDAR